ncbi:MAG: ATPase, T2SS/T4P/T4SS family, partial [Candidatus Methanomethylophilaceae archaeon]
TREIQLPHVNWLPMKTRESVANISGAGNISMFSLLKAALRQRPEYIIVGEVRGKEAQTLFQAMNTGHTTYSTLHAGNVKEAINRLTNEPINVPVAMFGALDLVLVQSLLYGEGKGFRRCLSLNEITVNDDKIIWAPLFQWNHKTDRFDKVYSTSAVFDNIAYQNNWSEEELRTRLDIKKVALEKMVASGDTSPKAVEKVIIETQIRERKNT